MNILHIDSGISPSGSISRLLSTEIVERLRGQDPSVTIVYRDLITDHIPYMNFRTLPGSTRSLYLAEPSPTPLADQKDWREPNESSGAC